jgi:hypothetical protein
MSTMADYSVQSVASSRFLMLKLISIQLTEPVALLFLAGLVLAVVSFAKEKFRTPFLVVLFWLFIPLTVVLLTQSSLCNFRQMFFLCRLFSSWLLLTRWFVGNQESLVESRPYSRVCTTRNLRLCPSASLRVYLL